MTINNHHAQKEGKEETKMNTLNCAGLKCPQPVINTKKFFDSIAEGEATVIVDNEVARTNVEKFAESNGFTVSSEEKEGLFNIHIVKKAGCECMNFSNDKSTCLVIGSEFLGNGDDKLGATLMKSYLFALSESDAVPTDMLFLNGGVKLTSEGSGCIESLNKLKERGVNISSCGTCLDFYGLKEKLLIGEITNMYAIVDKMASASNTIKL